MEREAVSVDKRGMTSGKRMGLLSSSTFSPVKLKTVGWRVDHFLPLQQSTGCPLSAVLSQTVCVKCVYVHICMCCKIH